MPSSFYAYTSTFPKDKRSTNTSINLSSTPIYKKQVLNVQGRLVSGPFSSFSIARSLRSCEIKCFPAASQVHPPSFFFFFVYNTPDFASTEFIPWAPASNVHVQILYKLSATNPALRNPKAVALIPQIPLRGQGCPQTEMWRGNSPNLEVTKKEMGGERKRWKFGQGQHQ